MEDFTQTLDQTVAHADPDRWRATRFIRDEAARADVVAVYALDHELARIPATVKQPMLAEIRLAWWREALEQALGGGPVKAHPTLETFMRAWERRALPIAPVLALADARTAELDASPFENLAALEAWIDASAGAVMALAAQTLAPAADLHALQPVARAWGVSRLVRSAPDRLPADLQPAPYVDAALRRGLRGLPPDAFPAVAYATLARRYARDLAIEDWEKTLRLTWATLRGRL